MDDTLREDMFLLEEHQRMVRRHESDSNDKCWFGRELSGYVQEVCHCFECDNCDKKLTNGEIKAQYGTEDNALCEDCMSNWESQKCS